MIGKSLLRPVGQKPNVCYCKPGQCSAPKPEWCIGKRASEMDAADLQAAHRASAMPTEKDAIRVMFDAWQRLKELGWRDGRYMPTTGERHAGIQSGSTGIHAYTAERDGLTAFGKTTYFVHDGDLWVSNIPPVLFRPWREDDVQPNLRICAPIPDCEPEAPSPIAHDASGSPARTDDGQMNKKESA